MRFFLVYFYLFDLYLSNRNNNVWKSSSNDYVAIQLMIKILG